VDIVYIRGLKIDTVIGVYDWERDIRQTLVLDLEMASDTRRGAATDAIEDALDYAAISDAITALVAGSDFQLLESVAEAVSSLVMEQFAVPWLRLRVGKPGAVAAADDVGVVIERGERG
jgi:7,8-dihydroneopterin aldolase/epimerase/oxygenase